MYGYSAFTPLSWNVTSRWILTEWQQWHSICRREKHNNWLKYRSNSTTRTKMKLLPVFERHLKFRGEWITSEGWHGDRWKAYPQKHKYSVWNLSLGSTELICLYMYVCLFLSTIYMVNKDEYIRYTWGNLSYPIAKYVCKNTTATPRLNENLSNQY